MASTLPFFDSTPSVTAPSQVLVQLVDEIQAFLAENRSSIPAHFGRSPPLVEQPRGFAGALITGVPGSGKSHLLQALPNHLPGVAVRHLDGASVFTTEEGASERFLTECFHGGDPSSSSSSAAAVPESLPRVLCIDNFEVLCARPSSSDLVRRVYTRLLALLDSFTFSTPADAGTSPLFLVAVVGQLTAIGPECLRPGRLQSVYVLSLKTPYDRLAILRTMVNRLPFKSPEDCETMLRHVAQLTHGYTPSDLRNVCTTVALHLIRQAHRSSVIDSPEQPSPLTLGDFQRALEAVRPSSLAEFQNRIPIVRFDEIFGLDTLINQLRTELIRPFRYPQVYRRLGLQPPAGILLHGPPGVGKTLLCCALAAEMGINTILVEGSQIRSKYVGESEKTLAHLFAKARQSAPCLILVDQLDVLAPTRGTARTSESTNERIVAAFLTELDGFHSKQRAAESGPPDLFIIATSNQPATIDAALLRPGRFDRHLAVPLPNGEQRKALIQGLAAHMPLQMSAAYRDQLVARTEGLSGADLKNILQEAALLSLRQDIQSTEITEDHVTQAIANHRA
ncbi:hypothetical protein H4R33_003390 [Dimargaris cristalligena]|nr:hypothetical protein H4R33_003390 [Dimargaris cristalligena]